MSTSKLHLHSMMVHSIAALVPLASVAWVFGTAQVSIGRFGPDLWLPLATASLAIVALMAVPSTVTGIGERNQMYARWHRTHKKKLILSLALMTLLIVELIALIGYGPRFPTISWLGFLIVVANNVVVFWLGALGLKITLGRQSMGTTSYVPDMFRSPPIDIIETNAAQLADRPKTIDPSSEE